MTNKELEMLKRLKTEAFNPRAERLFFSSMPAHMDAGMVLYQWLAIAAENENYTQAATAAFEQLIYKFVEYAKRYSTRSLGDDYGAEHTAENSGSTTL